MRIAIISEEYEQGILDGGLRNVRNLLHELLPEARFFVLGGTRYPKGFLSAWRLALRAENMDLGEFDVVITLGTGLASGVITQPFARHAAFFFAPPPLWEARGFAGHWYRVWSVQMAERVDAWVANSQFVREAIAKYFRKEASVMYPFGEVVISPAASNPGPDDVVLIAEASDAKTREVCRVACERSHVRPLFVGGPVDLVSERQRLLEQATFLLVPAAVSFSPWVVEALALGRPVLAYRGGGLPEYVEEGVAGLFFDDADPGVIADGMRRMREQMAGFNPAVLRTRAERFSAARFRDEFLKVLEGVVQ